jgi:3-dehydroquinate synthase
MQSSKVEYLKKLPTKTQIYEPLAQKPEKVLVIYDRVLKRNDAVNKWLGDFAWKYPVVAGEALKDLGDFATHVRKILKLMGPFSARSFCVLSVGGGTVGDFAGFLASTLKRGVPLVHVPSTWLAAMDSAHGGKNALNVGGTKNQIGTFYPPEAVLIPQILLESVPELELRSAAGELAKMALLAGGVLNDRLHADFQISSAPLWEALPDVVQAKMAIVEKDPFERGGERQLLNLGHTFGHALESYYRLPHGIAVGHGLIFAILWSAHQGYLKATRAEEMVDLLEQKIGVLRPKQFVKKYRAISRAKLQKLVTEDKKLVDSRHLSFVFIEEVGKCFRKNVTIDSLLAEAQRQGWAPV